MGTRGAIGFKLDQKEVIFYNHFDSYPDYLGNKMVEYVRSVSDWNEIREQVLDFQPVNREDIPTQEQIDKAYALGTVNLNVSGQTENDFYCLTRNAQGDLALQLVLGFGDTDPEFLLDSLFCEYAYIINLDTMEIEFYEGFNQDFDAEGRYAAKATREPAYPGASVYAGVKLVGEAPLDNIPDDWMERFYPSEKEEE